MKIRICVNAETVCDGFAMTCWQEESTDEASDAAFEVLANRLGFGANRVVEFDSIFRNWHGGKYDQFWHRRGLIASDYKSPSLDAILDEAQQAYLSCLNSIERRIAKEDMEFFADQDENEVDQHRVAECREILEI